MINNLYVFAIGGTGARVLRSLTMLLASGVKMNAKRIVPIIIDPDEGCGNTSDTVGIMNLYQNIHSTLTHTGSIEAFNTELLKLPFPNDYVLPMCGNIKTSFEKYIDYAGMSRENKALMNMLFSEENLQTQMDEGFLGNPNIGSVVLNQFSQSTEFGKFATDFSDKDGIFIISSIFGGTGASGFPLLLKNLRTAEGVANAATLQNAKIGAVSVMPYFNLDKGIVIDSDTFMQKTKAALSYYEKNMGQLEALYYIGDDDRKAQPNAKGGAAQQNKAHFVELATALAVFDYAESWEKLVPQKCVYKEFGIESQKSDTITFTDLSKNTYNQIARRLTEFALASKFMRDALSDSTSQTWYGNYTNVSRGDFDTFTQNYLDWLDEMGQKDRGTTFVPFSLSNTPNDVFGFVQNIGTKRVASLKSNWDLANDRLNNVSNNSVTQSANNEEGRFTAHVMLAMKKLVNEKINL